MAVTDENVKDYVVIGYCPLRKDWVIVTQFDFKNLSRGYSAWPIIGSLDNAPRFSREEADVVVDVVTVKSNGKCKYFSVDEKLVEYLLSVYKTQKSEIERLGEKLEKTLTEMYYLEKELER